MNKKEFLMDIKYFLKFLPDETYIKLYYRLIFKKHLNLNNPQTFNEKIQWLKLNDRKPIYSKLVDKYEVREYVKEKIGEEYLVPILGVWEKFEEIDFDQLPEKFVLKCTHDSGGIVICKDKKIFDIEEAKNKIEKCLKHNFYYIGREWPYKNVKPRIIAEKYLENINSKEKLMDYKFMCFNQKVQCSFVCSGRNEKEGLSVDFYDLEWRKMPFTRKYKNSNKEIKRPVNYKKMIKLAEILSEGIPFARIDFYEIDNKIYFGEITLYPGCGFEKFNPSKYDKILGDWIDLSSSKKKMVKR